MPFHGESFCASLPSEGPTSSLYTLRTCIAWVSKAPPSPFTLYNLHSNSSSALALFSRMFGLFFAVCRASLTPESPSALAGDIAFDPLLPRGDLLHEDAAVLASNKSRTFSWYILRSRSVPRSIYHISSSAVSRGRRFATRTESRDRRVTSKLWNAGEVVFELSPCESSPASACKA